VTPCLVRRGNIIEVFVAAGPAVTEPVAFEAASALLQSVDDSSVDYLAERAAYVVGQMRHIGTIDAVVDATRRNNPALHVRTAVISALADIVHGNQHEAAAGRGLDALQDLADDIDGPLAIPVARAMAVVRRTRFERRLDDPPVRWPDEAKQLAAWGRELLDDPMLPDPLG
jgi:hypothetical protein